MDGRDKPGHDDQKDSGHIRFRGRHRLRGERPPDRIIVAAYFFAGAIRRISLGLSSVIT